MRVEVFYTDVPENKWAKIVSLDPKNNNEYLVPLEKYQGLSDILIAFANLVKHVVNEKSDEKFVYIENSDGRVGLAQLPEEFRKVAS